MRPLHPIVVPQQDTDGTARGLAHCRERKQLAVVLPLQHQIKGMNPGVCGLTVEPNFPRSRIVVAKAGLTSWRIFASGEWGPTV